MTIIVELEIEGDASDAFHVVGKILDTGLLQDEINQHDYEDCGALQVTSAVVYARVAS